MHSDGTQLPGDSKIKKLNENEGYQYLGVMEANEVFHDHMKEKVSKEYLRRVRKVAGSKLNGGNLMQGINTWAVYLLRYAGGIINWSKEELKDIDIRPIIHNPECRMCLQSKKNR